MGKDNIRKNNGATKETSNIGKDMEKTTVEKEIIENEKINSSTNIGKESGVNIKYINENEINNSGRKNKKGNKAKKWIVISICILVIVALGGGTYYGLSIKKLVESYNDRVYPMAFVLDKDISGMTKDELHDTLEGMLNDIGNKEIKVTVGERNYEIARRALDLKIDFESIENGALSYGKNNKFLDRLSLIKEPQEKNYEVKLTYNEGAIKEFVEKIANEVYVDPYDASISIDNGAINIAEGQLGSELDSEKLISDIKNAVSDLGGEDIVNLAGNIKDVNPRVTTEALQSVNQIIGTYTTYFSAGPSGTNIGIGTTHIDDSLLMPGDIFSTVDAIGPTTREYGFVEANTYVDGRVVPGYGGGVCQIATTLYNAELRAGIEALERTNHMMTVGYAPIGLDATIGDYQPDLVFENPYDYPVVINAYTTGGSLVVEIWSNSNATNGIKYEPKAYPEGGLYADTYLYGYRDGEVVYEKYLHSSSYKPFS